MTTPKLVISIPHSGTRFLKSRLGIEHHVHTNTNWDTIWSNVQGKKLIAPLRRPNEIWRSWCRRNPKRPEIWTPSFYQGFFIMHTLDMLCDIEFVPVDLGQSHPEITDWSPVGSVEHAHSNWHLFKTDLRIVHKLPFVKRHYGSHS